MDFINRKNTGDKYTEEHREKYLFIVIQFHVVKITSKFERSYSNNCHNSNNNTGGNIFLFYIYEENRGNLR